MASENLNSFISLYKEKAQISLDRAVEKLEKRQSQLESFNELRPPLLEEAKTLGFLEDFERLFPENGEGPMFSQADMMTYSSMLESVDDSKQLKALYKIDSAPKRLKTAEEYLKYAEEDLARDPEEYLGKLHGALVGQLAATVSLGGGNMKLLFQKVFEDQDSYEEIIERVAENVDGPRGVKTNPATYAALKELVDSGTGVKQDEPVKENDSPINEGEASDAVDSEKESSAINETGEEITQEDDSTGLAEPSEKPETPPETTVESTELNIPEEEVSTTAINDEDSKSESDDTTASILSDDTAAPEENTSLESGESESQSINDTPPPPAPTAQPDIENTDVVNNITNIDNTSDNISSSTTNVDKSTGDNSSTINDIKKPINTSLEKGGVTYSQQSSSGPSSFINSFLQDTMGISNEEMSAITNMDSSTINSMGIESNADNSSTETSMSDSTKESNISNINQVDSVTGGVSNEINDANSAMNNTSETFKTDSNFSSFQESSIVKPEPITKEDIDAVGKDISSNVSTGMNTLSNTDSNESQTRAEKRAEKKENRQQRREEKQEGDVNVEGSSMDTASLEKRLKNIEILLMGPLEVKIKN